MTTPRLYKTEAIVLRQRKLGEADRILTLHTPAYGKLDAKAKGVRKTTSRMSGHLQPLSRCMVQLARGRSGLDVIAGCETLESFQALREDLDRLSRALYAAELADRFLAERVESMATYRLLLDTLRRLQDGNADTALRYYEMRLLGQSGFRPVAGGTYCPSCGAGAAGSRTLSLNALKVLRLLQRASYNEAGRVTVPPALAQEGGRHPRSYIACMLERA